MVDVTDQTLTTMPLADGDGSEMIGHTIDGRYHLEATLGRGGMGLVYRATHVTLRRRAAVKILHPSLVANADVRNRFEREALASGKIDHPNCVAVYDSGHLTDGSIYLAMELLEGESLADVLQRDGQLPVPRALHILAHLLRGLSHIHAAGLVHRDIKPENIFLVRNGDDPDFAKILDFGIAKPMRGELSDDGVKLTQAGMAFGTPIYMAPEQALGNKLDGRADVYAAAVVGFEMLAGNPPFYSDDKLEVMSMHTAKPVPPIRHKLPKGGRTVPASIERMIVRGLTKKPSDRYDSAEAMLAAVEAALGTKDGGDTEVEFQRLDTGSQPLVSDSGQVKIIAGGDAPDEPPDDSPRIAAIDDAIEEVLRAPKPAATPARGTRPATSSGRSMESPAMRSASTPGRGTAPPPLAYQPPPIAPYQPPSPAPQPARAPTPPIMSLPPMPLGSPASIAPMIPPTIPRPPVLPPPPGPAAAAPMFLPPDALATLTATITAPSPPPQPDHALELLAHSPATTPFPMPDPPSRRAAPMSRQRIGFYAGVVAVAAVLGIAIAVATTHHKHAEVTAGQPPYARDAYAAVDRSDIASAQALLDENKPASQHDALALLVQGLIYAGDPKYAHAAIAAIRAAIRSDPSLGDDAKLRATLETLSASRDKAVLADALDVWCSTQDPAAIRATDAAAAAVDDPLRHDAAMSVLARHAELAAKVDMVVAVSIDLQTAETCDRRRAALHRLQDLHDPRAIPIIDIVRREPRNSCLSSDAKAVLVALRTQPK